MNSPVNVLLYNGSGVSASSRDHALLTLRSFLSHRYDVQLVSPKSLRHDPWTDSCALLVFPGGRDIPYHFDLEGAANTRIRDWVQRGGTYLGFCAGAYYASSRVEFEVGTPLQVVGDRELNFFPGTCRGTVFPGFAYETEEGAKQVSIELNRAAWRDHWSQSPNAVDVWYNGGGAFLFDDRFDQDPTVEVLGRYGDLDDKLVAGVRCSVGAGTAVLWAVHPEHPTMLGSADETIPASESYDSKEVKRKNLLRATLAMLGLDVSDTPAPPPQLRPIFLTSLDPASLSAITTAVAHKDAATTDSYTGVVTLSDRHDQFVLHPPALAHALVLESVARPGPADPAELHHAPKDIVVCTAGPPVRSLTPLFDVAHYFELLASVAVAPEATPRIGTTLMYGEAVTSTQTMLDKNDQFLSALPTGLVCLASHQIVGRGRRDNSWVSPAGCLQFSFVVRVSMAQAKRIVFLQYLVGLAVVEAVRTREGCEEVPIRLKWPNDVYGDVAEGGGAPVYKKVAGILVNSSYAGSEFSLVIGCGVNLSNATPTTCVNELIKLHNARSGSTIAPLRPEELLARILAQLNRMWEPFLRDGFEPFTDLYLKRWIHSDQRVRIESTGQLVKMVGITPDHGLLRTVAIDVDRNGREVFGGGAGGGGGLGAFIDLQPDGNGFDMTQNLLVTKS